MNVGTSQPGLWLALTMGLCLTSTPVVSQTRAWSPDRNVEIVTTAAAGGAIDRVARIIQKIWVDRKSLDSITVVNKPGAGGALAWTYVSQRPGDGHILAITPGTILTNHITGRGRFGYADFTPLGIISNEYSVFAVRADSPFRNGRDVIQRIRQDPSSVTFGVAALGGSAHIALCLAMRAVGVDVRKLRIAVFDSGNKSLTALMGGHLDLVATGTSNALPQVQSGRIRLVAVSAAKRLGSGLPDVPTWREQGVDSVYAGWRLVFGAKGLTPEQIAYWDHQLAELVKSPVWMADLERYNWSAEYKDSRETAAFLASEHDLLKTLLTELGLAK